MDGSEWSGSNPVVFDPIYSAVGIYDLNNVATG